MDQIGELLVSFATLSAFVWAATEFLPKAIPWLKRFKRDFFALVLGPVSGLMANLAGLVPVEEGWRGYVAAVVMGIIATVLAGVTHDKVIKPALPQKMP